MNNQEVASRIGCFPGRVLRVGKYRLRGEWKGIVAALVREAGRDKQAQWHFTIRDGVGFVTPVHDDHTNGAWAVPDAIDTLIP